MTEMEIQSDNKINVIVDTEQIKNSKPEGFWAKLVYHIRRIWNKTIFARKMKENAWKRELMEEVKEESKEDVKAILKEQYLQREKDKITGNAKKGGFMGAMQKVGKALAEEGKSMGSGTGKYDDKISRMLGNSNKQDNNDKMSRMLGNSNKQDNDNNIGKILGNNNQQKVSVMGSYGNNIQEKIMGSPKQEQPQTQKKKKSIKDKEKEMRDKIWGSK